MIRVGPNNTFPTDNSYGIPCLRLDRQAILKRPLRTWGNVGRAILHRGTYSLYCDDYRFAGLIKSPDRLLTTKCESAIEPNISVLDDHPLAWTIWATHEKRRVARQWQDAGVSVFVDLCVPRRFTEINLLGVPRGWKSYATRGFAARANELMDECATADMHGGSDALVIVVGGGDRVRKACLAIPNAVFVEPEAPASESRKREREAATLSRKESNVER